MDHPNAAESSDSLEEFGSNSHVFNDHFDEYLQNILSACPVARSRMEDNPHLVGRYSDVEQIATDWKTFSNARGNHADRTGGSIRIPMEEADPPLHDKWRTALNNFFNVRTVRAHEENVRRHVNKLIDNFIERGSCDFSIEFATPLANQTLRSFCLPDFPDEEVSSVFADAEKVHTGSSKEIRAKSWDRVEACVDNYLRRRAAEPRKPDVIDAVLYGVETPAESPNTWGDKVRIVSDLLTANAPTSYSIAGLAYYLATNPSDRQALRIDGSLHRNAVEEVIRIYAPIVGIGRFVTAETEVGGSRFQAGDRLLIFFSAACRDPEKFTDPTHVDIRRRPIKNAAFGFGIHRCIGIHLARLEVKATLEALLSRMPDLSLTEGTKPTFNTNSLHSRTMTSLPLVFSPGEKHETQHS